MNVERTTEGVSEGVSDNLLEQTMTLSLLQHTMHRVLSMTNQ